MHHTLATYYVPAGVRRGAHQRSIHNDMTSIGMWTRDFMEAQGHGKLSLILHQDNMSTIRMLENGKSTSQRTRHINVSYFFMKERIDDKEVVVKYTKTSDMIADILTKPLQGTLFINLRKRLLSAGENVSEITNVSD